MNLHWQGFEKKSFTIIETYAPVSKPLMRDLTIEEALQKKIKDTIQHNNKSYVEWCDQNTKEN